MSPKDSYLDVSTSCQDTGIFSNVFLLFLDKIPSFGFLILTEHLITRPSYQKTEELKRG